MQPKGTVRSIPGHKSISVSYVVTSAALLYVYALSTHNASLRCVHPIPIETLSEKKGKETKKKKEKDLASP